MTSAFTIECRVHFNNRGRGSRKRPPSDRGSDAEAGRVPRVSRLMALARRLDELIRSGQVTGYAELARHCRGDNSTDATFRRETRIRQPHPGPVVQAGHGHHRQRFSDNSLIHKLPA